MNALKEASLGDEIFTYQYVLSDRYNLWAVFIVLWKHKYEILADKSCQHSHFNPNITSSTRICRETSAHQKQKVFIRQQNATVKIKLIVQK